jgi:hypothetical protein
MASPEMGVISLINDKSEWRERERERERASKLTFLEGYLVIISSSVVIDSDVAGSTRRWRGWGLLLLWWRHLRSS